MFLKLFATTLCKHLRVGSWVLIYGTAVFVGASCIPVEVDLLFLPHHYLGEHILLCNVYPLREDFLLVLF